MLAAALIVAGYFLGSIPFGLLLTRMAGLGDIRAVGSGNIGATNVLRTGNKALALATLLLDGGKGAAAVLIARAVSGDESLAIAAGAAAFLGHLFPIWLRFKGGKGVATFIGTLFALAWPAALAICGTWLVTVALFRMSSLGALVAALLAPLYAWLIYGMPLAGAVAVLSALIFYRHQDNITRIFSGTEPKIGAPKTI
jgi:acyl phosphate:glycerol-3-phosphate acyltransferase